MEQILPEVLRLVKRADWQKQENQVEESGLATQLPWACWRIEQETPHSGNKLEPVVGTRFLSAAQVVERREREKSSKASQRVAQRDVMVDKEEIQMANPRRRAENKGWTGLDWTGLGSCQWQPIF